mmetsp:Transcript_7366/g.10103  ORF Transcript_7366/g.10103 Transcript_7366/m.10103 type:complete len:97 (-) Transcript_7366:616-906(-)
MQRHEKVHCVVVLLAMAVAEGDLVMSEAGGKLYVEVCEGRCGPRRPLRSSLLQTICVVWQSHLEECAETNLQLLRSCGKDGLESSECDCFYTRRKQ